MASTLTLSAYDLSDEGPARRVNEDATLVREDLGLFIVADGAGGKGRGDVAAALAVRTIENYIGATVRQTHERPDYDRLGNPEQARRLSRAVHQAHQNILDALSQAPERAGMATTIVCALRSPRTGHLHVAHVGDSRCYRLRHGQLELLTRDHSMGNDVLERRPDTPDEVLARLPRNSVVRALGMPVEMRVDIQSVRLAPGDRFLLCSNGLSDVVHFDHIARLLDEHDSSSVLASHLLADALAAKTRDNVSVLVIDCSEHALDQELPTHRYNEIPDPSQPLVLSDYPDFDDEFPGEADEEEDAEIATAAELDAFDAWITESEMPTAFDETSTLQGAEVIDDPVVHDDAGSVDVRDLLERPAVEIPRHPRRDGRPRSSGERWDEEPPPSYKLEEEDLELEVDADQGDDAEFADGGSR